MADINVSSNAAFRAVKESQQLALTSMKKSKRVLLALRMMGEEKLEKSLATASIEATDVAFKEVARLGTRVRDLEHALIQEQGGAE